MKEEIIMATKRKTAETKTTHGEQLVVRIPKELMDRVDAHARLRDDEPGPAWTRADAVRRLLELGLREDDKRLTKRGGR
jgi:hypothetical protein